MLRGCNSWALIAFLSGFGERTHYFPIHFILLEPQSVVDGDSDGLRIVLHQCAFLGGKLKLATTLEFGRHTRFMAP